MFDKKGNTKRCKKSVEVVKFPHRIFSGGLVMHSFEYCCPTEIIFGRGAEDKVAEKIRKYGGSRVMILYGAAAVLLGAGLLAKLKNFLPALK